MKKLVKKNNQALKLRKSGLSIRVIAKKLQISTSTASVWCRNIELTPEQKAKLALKSSNIELLRKFSQKRHEDKVLRHQSIFSKSKLEIDSLSNQEIFIVGLALYWAEGFKNINEGRLGFCNSDPRMIRFMMFWFKKTFNLTSQDFLLRAEFNQTHIDRRELIEEYWSKVTEIPLSQFNKSFIQKYHQLKNYSNRDNYYGVLRIRIKKSLNLLIKMRGWIEGLGEIDLRATSPI